MRESSLRGQSVAQKYILKNVYIYIIYIYFVFIVPLGILATVGATKIKVYMKPTIALLSTGNELQNPQDGELNPGFIRDSNKSTLITLINKEHGFPIFDCGIATDDLENLKAKLSLALDKGDMIVTTGGVSMGDKDLLRQVLVQVCKKSYLTVTEI